ncbi:MAG: baseplate J/gp47 family protein [Candidatus Doudnabacteria bacterium]|nr:baseplate J/gp47 family protein [Candidatus Doudnabacteria bacterium]
MRVIKLKKSDDIAAVIQIIKDLKDREVVFEFEDGSPLLTSSSNLKLMKKTGEVMGKKVRVRTNDPTGRMLAIKAEALDGEAIAAKVVTPRPMPSRMRSMDSGPRFSDIRPNTRAVAPMRMPRAAVESPYVRSAPEQVRPVKARRSGNFSKIFVVTVVVLVLSVFALAVLLPTANITVYARSEPITRDTEITVDKSATSPDVSKMVVPGQAISREVSQTKNFPATGVKNVGTKATGSVQLYNFTKNTLTLKSTTTVLLANGKKFLFTKDVTGLRPTATIGTGAEAEVDPSSLIPPIAIVAQDPGEDSNIAANTKFNIVNAALGNQNVYGVDTAALTGGTTKTIKIISQPDLDNAAASMTNSIAEQAESDFNQENSTSDIKILPTGITKEVLAKTANRKAGDEGENFDMTMIARISGLSYNESQVKDLVKQKITSVLSDDKFLVDKAEESASASFKSLDLARGTGVLSVHYETVAAYKIDTENLPKILAGKNANEIKEILLTKPEIDRVDVEFSPFFVNKAPKLNGKIYIHNKLSQE